MIYVDAVVPAKWRYRKACHLFTDGDVELLHDFARALGLERRWFQDHARLPHYDLTESKRLLALWLGAQEASRKKVVECMKGQDHGRTV